MSGFHRNYGDWANWDSDKGYLSLLVWLSKKNIVSGVKFLDFFSLALMKSNKKSDDK